jgi:hypothetical protein
MLKISFRAVESAVRTRARTYPMVEIHVRQALRHRSPRLARNPSKNLNLASAEFRCQTH